MEVTKTIVVQVQVHEMDSPKVESVAPTAEVSSAALTEPAGATAIKAQDASNTANSAGISKTMGTINKGLSVAMPVLNALSNGMAGQVMGHVNRAAGLINSAATGSIGGIIGSVASIAAWGVGQAVNAGMTQRKANESVIEGLEATNIRRQIAGLPKIEYDVTGVTKKLVYK